jgi:hypothetical protein
VSGRARSAIWWGKQIVPWRALTARKGSRPRIASDANGVRNSTGGEGEHPVPAVGSPDQASRYAHPACVIPQIDQICHHGSNVEFNI